MTLAIARGTATVAALVALAAGTAVAAPGEVPIQTDARIAFASGQLLAGGVLFQVPADQMFVAHHVSLSLALPSGQSPVNVVLNGGLQSFGTGGTEHFLAPLHLGAFPGGQENYATSQPVRLYFPPGNNVGYQVFRSDTPNAGLALGRIVVTGVLIKCGRKIQCPAP